MGGLGRMGRSPRINVDSESYPSRLSRLSRLSCLSRLLVAAAAVGLAISALSAAPAPPPDLDSWVARAMRTFDVPGIGLAVVKDDAIVVSKGYGVRKLGDPGAVDAHTLFGIASNTKAFTATALGLLVEENKIEWDAPVTRYLPWFAMWDRRTERPFLDFARNSPEQGRRAADDSLHPHARAERRARTVAARHLHRPVEGPRAAGRRLRHICAQPGRLDRSGEDAGGLAGHGLQL